MKTMKSTRLWLGLAMMLLLAGNAWPAPDDTPDRGRGIEVRIPPVVEIRIPPRGRPFDPPRAPEIDAASGTSAIALLSGLVLLLRERSRSRRS